MVVADAIHESASKTMVNTRRQLSGVGCSAMEFEEDAQTNVDGPGS